LLTYVAAFRSVAARARPLHHAACISRRANTILIAQGAELLGRYDSDARTTGGAARCFGVHCCAAAGKDANGSARPKAAERRVTARRFSRAVQIFILEPLPSAPVFTVNASVMATEGSPGNGLACERDGLALPSIRPGGLRIRNIMPISKDYSPLTQIQNDSGFLRGQIMYSMASSLATLRVPRCRWSMRPQL
jgi:hypothetical protein